MGDPSEHLSSAKKYIEKEIGAITKFSGIYKTAAWGNKNQPDFLNQIIIAHTHYTAHQTITKILAIEKEMGRMRSKKNAPRIIDIDILFFNNEIIESTDLIVPHAEIQNRRFVLVPLNELCPDMMHPVLRKSMSELLEDCADKLNVQKI